MSKKLRIIVAGIAALLLIAAVVMLIVKGKKEEPTVEHSPIVVQVEICNSAVDRK